jgi:hypothetical protein
LKKILSTSEVGSILALIAPSPFFQIGGFLYFGGHFGWYKNPPIWKKFGFQVDYDIAN